jgi:hypothetical protein
MLPIFKALITAVVLIGTTYGVAGAEGVTSWCGNSCSSSERGTNNIECEDWQRGAAGQTCQAKAICSSFCTAWPTAQNPAIDALAITHEEARRLHGAVIFRRTRPSNR